MLNLQLAHLRSEQGFVRLRVQVKAIAGWLEETASIPMRQLQLSLIQENQTDEWWQDVTVPTINRARKRLRLLVKQARKPIYTYFEDQIGSERAFELPGFSAPDAMK